MKTEEQLAKDAGQVKRALELWRKENATPAPYSPSLGEFMEWAVTRYEKVSRELASFKGPSQGIAE